MTRKNHALVTCPVVLALAIDRTNPSVISYLVGDMVVDCVGSYAHEVAIESPVSFVFFPMVVHDFDIVVSSIGILCVTEPGPTESDPMTTLQRGYSITFLLVLAGFGLSTRWLLFSSAAPGAWLHFFLCVIVGMASWAWLPPTFLSSRRSTTPTMHAPPNCLNSATTDEPHPTMIMGISVALMTGVNAACSITCIMLSPATNNVKDVGKRAAAEAAEQRSPPPRSAFSVN
ncbi:hypothetical protein H257_12951 [Aphanomyces astaci]|uniref:H(+)-exporting diphosphatase n=1 Tax=Aphanomyces astaci TaxID=112090 RepID=W4FWE2_APHAT|nr:hypothetical protein H257_12951 [Aphanomyces astaci]ETV71807.1 hypothetical protein H257_12951 [Aphanomyces astaci]|eukprot:XP_009838656.1 hypothetical protein H257_12951 [Aphanomyces astaci]